MKILRLEMLNRRMAGIYNNITSSIAFYPIIITLVYLVVVIIMLRFDYSEKANDLKDALEWIQFKEMETVREIFTTLISSIITLMALSFSMVMVVLSQATNAVSPKVMQGLITRKEHQFVLGNQIGSILYFMVVLLLLRGIDFYRIPTFSVALGLLLGFWCLSLFVYFIHSISNSVQVTHIVSGTYNATLAALNTLKSNLRRNPEVPPVNFVTPFIYKTDKPGFLQEININGLMQVACKYDLQIEMAPYFAEFIPGGSILFRANKPETEIAKEDLEKLYGNILYFDSEKISTNHVYGFTQLSEIAVKSLSPGINDPGIAVQCVQFLTDIFILLYGIQEKEIYADAQNTPRLKVKNTGYRELLTITLTPIRNYGKQDQSVARALLNLLLCVGQTDGEKKLYQDVVNQHVQAVINTMSESNILPAEAFLLNEIIKKMQEVEGAYFDVKLLAPARI